METITLKVVNADSRFEICTAIVKGEVIRQGIETSRNSMGGANVTHYEVDLAGHKLPGTWADDARYNTTVVIESNHPLAASARLIAASQNAWRDLQSMESGKTPNGWRYDDWRNAILDQKQVYNVANETMKADPVALSLLD